MKLCRYRPAFFTGFDEPGDIIRNWDGKLTAESVPWLESWLNRGGRLVLKPYYKTGSQILVWYVSDDENDEHWVVAFARPDEEGV